MAVVLDSRILWAVLSETRWSDLLQAVQWLQLSSTVMALTCRPVMQMLGLMVAPHDNPFLEVDVYAHAPWPNSLIYAFSPTLSRG